MISFSGQSLVKLRRVTELALSGVRQEIGLHPEPLKYPQDIEDLEADEAHIQRLQKRIDRAIEKEQQDASSK